MLVNVLQIVQILILEKMSEMYVKIVKIHAKTVVEELLLTVINVLMDFIKIKILSNVYFVKLTVLIALH